ncbi:hypothetical protein BV898_15906 [Hypsibius exemplaris]|uniref:CAS1 domain-containing protein 1 n=1 Tax=Hypsibius exemplaris TaxID=2072580 RepID=A0A9X6RKP1_HYPEX|nr:hypothetical protein BV898_15906 [Hypsibius exemplaris]
MCCEVAVDICSRNLSIRQPRQTGDHPEVDQSELKNASAHYNGQYYQNKVQRFVTPARIAVPVMLLLFVAGLHVNNVRNLTTVNGALSCAKLFKAGSLQRNATTESGVWKPDGCAVRYRSINESIKCMADLTDKNLNAPFIVFAGDSRLRQLRDGLIFALTGQDYDVMANPHAKVDPSFYKKHAAHGDFYKSAGAHVRFEWLPYLDNGDGDMTKFIKRTIQSEFKPNLLVLGAGVWRIRDCERAKKSQETCSQEYKLLFLKLLPLLLQLSNTTDIIWTPQAVINEKLLRHPDDLQVGFNNRNMQLYNGVVREVLDSVSTWERPPVTFWHSAWETSVQLNDGIDGLHFGVHTKHHLIQMLINWMCSSVTRELSVFQDYTRFIWGNTPEEYCCE